MESLGSVKQTIGHSALLAPAQRRCPRVLVVDDERQIVELLAALLEDEGFEVARAYDGEEGWRRAVRDRPDLVISDVSMPRLDGMQLLARIRTTRALRDTPVILMSAAERELPKDEARLVPKPFDIDVMLSLVQRSVAPPEADLLTIAATAR
jgi:CheY-like chemotaxis protein